MQAAELLLLLVSFCWKQTPLHCSTQVLLFRIPATCDAQRMAL
jgi:hypothetical protein